MSEIYGFTPTQIAELTLHQFGYYRSYALRAKQENLLGHYNFAEGKYNVPGISQKKDENSDDAKLRQAIKEYQAATGKKLITPQDYAIIKEQMQRDK